MTGTAGSTHATYLASSGGASAGIWFGLWIGTAVIGVVLFMLAGSRIPGIDEKTERYRRAILIAGFLPCFGINVVNSLIAFTMYKVRVRGMGASHVALNASLNSQSFDTPTPKSSNRTSGPADNPFG